MSLPSPASDPSPPSSPPPPSPPHQQDVVDAFRMDVEAALKNKIATLGTENEYLKSLAASDVAAEYRLTISQLDEMSSGSPNTTGETPIDLFKDDGDTSGDGRQADINSDAEQAQRTAQAINSGEVDNTEDAESVQTADIVADADDTRQSNTLAIPSILITSESGTGHSPPSDETSTSVEPSHEPITSAGQKQEEDRVTSGVSGHPPPRADDIQEPDVVGSDTSAGTPHNPEAEGAKPDGSEDHAQAGLHQDGASRRDETSDPTTTEEDHDQEEGITSNPPGASTAHGLQEEAVELGAPEPTTAEAGEQEQGPSIQPTQEQALQALSPSPNPSIAVDLQQRLDSELLAWNRDDHHVEDGAPSLVEERASTGTHQHRPEDQALDSTITPPLSTRQRHLESGANQLDASLTASLSQNVTSENAAHDSAMPCAAYLYGYSGGKVGPLKASVHHDPLSPGFLKVSYDMPLPPPSTSPPRRKRSATPPSSQLNVPPTAGEQVIVDISLARGNPQFIVVGTTIATGSLHDDQDFQLIERTSPEGQRTDNTSEGKDGAQRWQKVTVNTMLVQFVFFVRVIETSTAGITHHTTQDDFVLKQERKKQAILRSCGMGEDPNAAGFGARVGLSDWLRPWLRWSSK